VIAGRGNLGRSLARAFRRAGHRVLLTRARGGARSLGRALATRPKAIVFLTVPDSHVAGLAAEISDPVRSAARSVAFAHTSGALRLDALSALAGDHPVGSFHPLQSFPRPRAPEAFEGIVVAVDAKSLALQHRLERLARDLGAHPRVVRDADRGIYHAAAVFASNFVIALVDESIGLLEEIGWDRRDAARGLEPLMELALQGALERGPVAALTGPIRRGDVDTVRRHVKVLEALDARPGARTRRLDVYRMLGSITLRIAQEAGLEPAAAEPIARALTRDVAATRRRRQR
jgi:predicted short-subunit dehydrogenase-like oxidoreductase (DUF2520 family)